MNEPAHSGEVIGESGVLTLDQLCGYCRVERQTIVGMVDEGLLQVEYAEVTQWRFEGADVRRVQVAMRLQRDLGVNLPGVALALQLLQQLEELQRQLHHGPAPR